MFLSLTVNAQYIVVNGSTINLTPEEFINTYLLGGGVQVVPGSATFNGSSAVISSNTVLVANQVGYFSAAELAAESLGLQGGIILASGDVAASSTLLHCPSAPPANCPTASGVTNSGSDPDLDILCETTSNDKSVLEFDFIPQTDVITFRYVFASEEFDEFCYQYNDSFGFFISGPGIAGGAGFENDAENIALLEGTSEYVTINHICAEKDKYSWCNIKDVSPSCNSGGGPDFTYDRFTFVFVAVRGITPCVAYHMKLAVADALDHQLDTGVFLEENSFTSNNIQVVPTFSNPDWQYAVEGCSSATVTFSIPQPKLTDFTINYVLAGTAVMGDDYETIPTSVTIPAGSVTATVTVNPIFNNDWSIREDETVIFRVPNPTCEDPDRVLSTTVTIKNYQPLTVQARNDGPKCEGQQVRLWFVPNGGQDPYSGFWSNGSSGLEIYVNPPVGQTSYTVTVTDGCAGTASGTTTVTINNLPLQPGPVEGPDGVCYGQSGVVFSVPLAAQPLTTYIWTIPAGATIVGGAGTNTITVDFTTATVSGTITVKAHNNCGDGPSVSKDIIIYPLPVPVITGPPTSCAGATGVIYSTEAGMTGYSWSISSAGIIQSGSTTSTISVDWTTAGTSEYIKLNYTDIHQCQAASPTFYYVTVNPLPEPVINGENSVCPGIGGKLYATASGKNNYIWTIPPQATITAGGTSTDNSVTLTWNTVGTFSLSVVYTEPSTQCTAGTPGSYTVTVNPLPAPTLTGENPVCVGIAGKTYTTQTGKQDYVWTISPQATVTGGGSSTDNTVTVTWNTAGTFPINVIYTEPSTLCTAVTPGTHTITVNTLPTPTFTAGESPVCVGVDGKTYTTQSGKSNYIWTIPSEATITAGGTSTDNSVTMTWNTVGSYTISVNYTEPSTQCTAVNPTNYNITVNPLPIPSFTSGVSPVCVGVTGKTYVTQSGKSSYVWTIPPEATITAGGTSSSNSVTLTWNAIGNYTLLVNYIEPSTQCTAVSPAPYSVTVNPLPVPTITGPASTCLNVPVQYSTEGLMTGYSWNVSPGGIIQSGQGSRQVQVNWTAVGNRTISVNYIDPNGCTAVAPISLNVNVNTLPVPSISGDNPVCERFTSSYTTEPGAQSYSWTLPTSGVTIISGGGINDNTVTIQWNTPGAYSISVNYVISTGCTAPQPTIFPVTVKPSPTPTFVQGTPELCQGTTGVIYSTQTGMSSYTWIVSTGGTITSGGTPVSSSVTVSWTTPGAQSVSVNYTNSNGCTALNPTVYTVTVNPLPVSTFTGNYTVCQLHPDAYLYTADAGPLCSYSWSIIPNTSGTVANPSANPGSVTWNTPGISILRLDAITGSGCTSFSTKLVQVNPRADVSITACFDPVTSRSAKPFLLKGGKPLLTGSPQQGEYLISPSTSALYYSTGYYYFDPSIVPGTSQVNYVISYKYTNQYNCPATTTTTIPLTVRGPNPACGSSMTDYRDGTSYRTSLVAGKCWMMENLRYGSTLIPTTKAQTDNCTTERYCLSSDVNCSTYGGLYQWDELIQYGQISGPDYQGVCPPGWHVPSSLDWQNLINDAGGNGLAAGSLTDMNLTPEGFEALLQGIYYMNTHWAFTVSDLPIATMYWTSTPGSGNKMITRGINSKNASVSLYESSKANAFPVRCVRD